MQLTAVRSFLLSYPFAEPIRLPFAGGERTIVKRDAMLIRVQRTMGWWATPPGQAASGPRQAIEHTIGPFLEGRSLVDPDALRVRFLQGPGADPELAQRLLRCRSRALRLLAKDRMACRSRKLLGGRVRDRIRLYGSAGMYMPPEALPPRPPPSRSSASAPTKCGPRWGPNRISKPCA